MRRSQAQLTPVWRSAEFQEREIFDLFGIVLTARPEFEDMLGIEQGAIFFQNKEMRNPQDFRVMGQIVLALARAPP